MVEKLEDSVELFLADCSPSTAETYRSAFTKHFIPFLASFDFKGQHIGSPENFLNLVITDQSKGLGKKSFVFRETIKEFRRLLTEKGLADKGILTRIGAVQSYFKHNEVPVTTKFTGSTAPIVQTKSYAWTIEMFEKFSALLNAKYRALDACLFQSGLGISDILIRKYSDISKEFEADIVPVCLNVVRIKTKVEHRSFLGPEAILLLKSHFAESGTPKPDEPLFKGNGNAALTDRTVEEVFANRAHQLIGNWPYRNPMGAHSRRKFFRKRMVKEGKCPSEFAEYFMGHNLGPDMKKTYSEMNDDEWRGVYKEYMPYLAFKILPYNK